MALSEAEKCRVCRRESEPGSSACAGCNAALRQIAEAHTRYCHALDDTPERRARVALYERRAELGVPLFAE